MAMLTPSPKMQFVDANGNPLSGGKLYTYATGTTTPLPTYTDSTGQVQNTNPVILDSRGEASVWLGSSRYSMTLKNSADSLVWTADGIGGYVSLSELAASGGALMVGYTQGGTGSVSTTVQAKLRESISVKDFGAVGDGAADDTAALTNFFANVSGKLGIIPAGTYKITSMLSLTLSNCAIFGLPGSSIITGSVGQAGVAVNSPVQSIVRLLTCSNVYASGVSFINTFVSATEDGHGVVYSVPGNSQSNITFEECTFSAPSWNTSGLSIMPRWVSGDTSTVNGLYIRKCKFQSLGRIGIQLMNRAPASDCYSAFQHFEITDCTLSDLGRSGTYGIGITIDTFGQYGLIARNKITSGNYISIENLAFSYVNILHNECDNIITIDGTGGTGTQLGYAENNIIEGNVAAGSFTRMRCNKSSFISNKFTLSSSAAALFQIIGSDNVARDNIIVGVGASTSGIQILSSANTVDSSAIVSANNYLENNTIDFSGSSGLTILPAAFSDHSGTAPSHCYNNIIFGLKYKLPAGGALHSLGVASQGSPGGTNQPIACVVDAMDVTNTTPIRSNIAILNFAANADYTVGFSSASDMSATALVMTDTTAILTVGRNVILPTYKYVRVVKNNTTKTLTFKTAAGTGVAVLAGTSATVTCDGTNIV